MRRRRHPLAFQFQVVWRREGDRYDRHSRIFGSAAGTYRFLQRMCGDQPWRGINKVGLRRSWAYLARQLQAPIASVIELPTREAVLRLRQGNVPILWLRVVMRQVGAWTEVVDPMAHLRPKQQILDKQELRNEAHCDELDAHPEKRWVPEFVRVR